jgi:hypothetical protein
VAALLLPIDEASSGWREKFHQCVKTVVNTQIP